MPQIGVAHVMVDRVWCGEVEPNGRYATFSGPSFDVCACVPVFNTGWLEYRHKVGTQYRSFSFWLGADADPVTNN